MYATVKLFMSDGSVKYGKGIIKEEGVEKMKLDDGSTVVIKEGDKVGLYTGLKDLNLKEIYTHDIMAYKGDAFEVDMDIFSGIELRCLTKWVTVNGLDMIAYLLGNGLRVVNRIWHMESEDVYREINKFFESWYREKEGMLEFLKELYKYRYLYFPEKYEGDISVNHLLHLRLVPMRKENLIFLSA